MGLRADKTTKTQAKQHVLPGKRINCQKWKTNFKSLNTQNIIFFFILTWWFGAIAYQIMISDCVFAGNSSQSSKSTITKIRQPYDFLIVHLVYWNSLVYIEIHKIIFEKSKHNPNSWGLINKSGKSVRVLGMISLAKIALLPQLLVAIRRAQIGPYVECC